MAADREKLIQDQVGADVPTNYANSLALAITPFDLSLIFGQRFGEQPPVPSTRVVMSHEHALVMLLILRRAMREHFKSTGTEPKIPESVLKELQLNEESPLW